MLWWYHINEVTANNWQLSTLRFHLQAPALQMCCNNLTKVHGCQGTVLVETRGHPSYFVNVTPCLVFISHFVLPLSFAQNKLFPYMLMTANNSGCKLFAQCPWAIYYMCKVWIGYWYSLQNYGMLNITKNPDTARQGKTREDKRR